MNHDVSENNQRIIEKLSVENRDKKNRKGTDGTETSSDVSETDDERQLKNDFTNTRSRVGEHRKIKFGK